MQEGDRVGTISHVQDDTLYLFGFGVYVGEKKPSECPQKPGGMIGGIVTQANGDNPLIELDDGNYVWGCECWFGSEEKIRKKMRRYDAVRTVSITEKRAEYSEYGY